MSKNHNATLHATLIATHDFCLFPSDATHATHATLQRIGARMTPATPQPRHTHKISIHTRCVASVACVASLIYKDFLGGKKRGKGSIKRGNAGVAP